jgi:hypothetical protein
MTALAFPIEVVPLSEAKKARLTAYIFQSWDEHDSEAKGITAAMCTIEGQYIVRDISGKAVTITSRSDFALATRMNTGGTIYDRRNWKTTSPRLTVNDQGEVYAR